MYCADLAAGTGAMHGDSGCAAQSAALGTSALCSIRMGTDRGQSFAGMTQLQNSPKRCRGD